MNDMNNYTHYFPEDHVQQLLDNQIFFYLFSFYSLNYSFDLQVRSDTLHDLLDCLKKWLSQVAAAEMP